MKNFSRNDERQEFTEEAQCIPNEIYLKNESIIMLLPLKFQNFRDEQKLIKAAT